MSPFFLALVVAVCALVPVNCKAPDRQDEMAKRVIRNMILDSKPKTLPPTEGDKPVRVSIGYSLVNVYDLSNRGFSDLTGMLTLSWNDPRLAFRSVHFDIYFDTDRLRLPASDIWTPDVELFNTMKPGTKVLIDKPLAVVTREGDVTLINTISTRGHCDVIGQIKSQSFANCTLKFGSWTHSGLDLDMRLQEGGDPLSEFSLTGKWNVTAASAVRNVQKYACCPESYIDVTYSYRFQKRN